MAKRGERRHGKSSAHYTASDGKLRTDHATAARRGESGGGGDRPPGTLMLVGAKLRERRRHLNLTLQDIADRAGITKGFLSEVERDRAVPSVATLLKLRDALSLAVSTLFHSAVPQVVREKSRQGIPYGGVGMTCVLVSPENAHRVIAIHAEFIPGGGSGSEPYSLDSDEEIILVVTGSLEVTISGETYRLNAGDSITFDPRVPHSYRNTSPKGVTRTLCIIAPPPR